MKFKRLLLPVLISACLFSTTACGNSAGSAQDTQAMETMMESMADSIAESVAESVIQELRKEGVLPAQSDSTGSPADNFSNNQAAPSDGSSNDHSSNNPPASSNGNPNDNSSNNPAASSNGSWNNNSSNNSANPSSGTANGTSNTQATAQKTPIGDGFAGEHGALRVEGAKLVDQNGDPIQLYGMSTHGIAWYPQFVSYDTFKTLRDDWNTNCVRLAMYTHEYSGYCSGGDQDYLKSLVRTGVDAATDLGMYVIIDWHVLQEQDPNVYKSQSLDFFKEMSLTYADHTNVIYEICNEPNGYATWDSVKSYAEEVIPVIRANDPDAVIIVGTPTWSQDIDKAFSNPIKEDNLLYALHFYAGTHRDVLWNRLDSCAQNGLPVFVSEFGMCDASGNGANDFNSTKSWFDVIDKYNVSFMCWNLANKNESSSVIKDSCSKVSDWTVDELSESGKWIREHFRSK